MPGQKFGPAWFPGLIAAGLGICGLFLIVSEARRRSGAWIAWPDWVQRSRPALGVASVVIGLLFYILAANTLGFHITGVLLLAIWMRILGAAWRVAAPVALLATLAIHLSFYKLLRIPLPWGVFEQYAF